MGDLELKEEFCPTISLLMQSFDIPQEMRMNYLERRLREFEEMRLLDDSAICEQAKKIGHRMKGNADSFGFYELTDAAFSLEDAGKNKNPQAVREVLSRLKLLTEANLQRLH